MAELVAVQSGLALFKAGEVGVIIDTQDLNPYDPQPISALLAAGDWDSDSMESREVPSACFELADVALEGAQAVVSVVASAADARVVRVPKKVQDAVRIGLEAIRANESSTVPLVAAALAEKLLSGSVTVEQVKRIHTHSQFGASQPAAEATQLIYGGDAGRDWSARVCGGFGITAAAPPVAATPDAPDDETEWTDPAKPHVFAALAAGDATCALCDKPMNDPIHVTAAQAAPAAASVEYFATLMADGDKGTTFKVDSVLALDEEGSWWLRELGEWHPTQAPDATSNIVQLDTESFNAAAHQLDEPGTAFAELSISEERLFELAEPTINWDGYKALFAAAPYVPPEVRSANAKKQLRDAKGHFILQGGNVQDANGERGTVESVDHAAGTVSLKTSGGTVKTVPANSVTVDKNGSPHAAAPAGGPVAPAAVPAADAPLPDGEAVKARLDAPPVLVQDVGALIKEYQQKWNDQQDVPADAPTAPVTAAGSSDDSMLIPPPDPGSATPAAAPTPTATAPDDSSAGGADPVSASQVTPLYLAEVDPHDTEAVLDCIAVIPAAAAGDAVETYKRSKGTWTLAPDVLQALQGPTPPPVVELDSDMLTNVLGQMDSAQASETAPDTAPAPVAAAGYAVLRQFSLTAGGDLASSQVRGARLLMPFGDTLPDDIVGRLDELAAGVDTHPAAAERLRVYWTTGEGGQKIRWGVDGDYDRCVHHLSKYMGERAHGYCQLRHKDATGFYAGHAPGESKPRVAALVGEVQVESEFDVMGSPDANDPDLPHDFNGPGAESDLFDGECATCGRPLDHPVHVVVVAVPDDSPGDDVMEDGVTEPDADDAPEMEPHSFTPAGDAPHCECGRDPEDAIHTGEDLSPYSLEFAGIEDNFTQPHVWLASTDPDETDTMCECGRLNDDRMHVVTAAAPSAPSVLADSATEVTPGQKFRIPLVVPEGVSSGDGRTFAENSLTSRDMPLALMWQPEGDEGHKGSVIVGRIDHVERTTEGLGNAFGVFDTGPWGQEALRLVKAGMLRGISADLDEFEADVLGGGEDENKVTSTKLMVQSGRLMGITLVAKPAYAECTIELADEGDGQVPDGEYTQDSGEARVAALIASAAPLVPPKSWFSNPELTKPTHLTIDDDGRVFGHIAAWDVDHIGLPFGTRAPRSASNYAYFRTGVVRTQEGDDVPVGQLTLAGGHAPLQADARMAVKHYDDTASAVADLAAGEDGYGIWVAGALRPGVTPEQVRALRASSPSGDWRPIRNKLELVAVCQVNVPGFPVARAMVSSGVVTALVAAGAMALELPEARAELSDSDINIRIAALEAAEQRRLDAQALAIRERMSPALRQKQEALTAAALSAKERVDAVRNERKAKLEETKAQLKARVAAGFPDGPPPFKEDEHPRAHDGKFRMVLAHLTNLFAGEKHADPGLAHVADAADKEENGDHAGAAKAADAGAAKFEDAAKSAVGDVKAKLQDAAGQLREVAAAEDPNAPGGASDEVSGSEIIFDSLAQPMKEMVEEAVTRAEQKLDPANPQEMLEKLKAFITGTNPMDPQAVANFVKNQLKRPFKPHAPVVAPQAPSAQPSAPSPSPV